MEGTRRLSLTLLLVTPIIAARRLSFEDLGINSAGTAWGETSGPEGDWSSWAESKETFNPEVYDDGDYGDIGSWLRRKRALDAPGDDLETAEQVLFRPTFRYKHLVKEREEHHRKQELRRQFTKNSPSPAPSSHSVVASLPPKTPSPQRNYYSTFPLQNQRVYTPQVSSSQRLYATNFRGIVPNYRYPTVQSQLQFPQTLQYAQNTGLRPQRSPYAYFLPQRIN